MWWHTKRSISGFQLAEHFSFEDRLLRGHAKGLAVNAAIQNLFVEVLNVADEEIKV